MSRGATALRIAWRYLTAPKSHGAVSAISIVSVVGVAVATAAIVVVLSVFNGFRFHLNQRLDTLTPDIAVTPAYGKTIADGDSLAQVLREIPGVREVMEEVTDNALVIAQAKEMPIRLQGVDMDTYGRLTSIDSLLLDGTFASREKSGSISVGVASRLGIFSAGDSIFLFAPKRMGRINLANPISSFLTDSLEVGSVFRSMQNEFDENTVICDIETARELFQYTTEATGISVKAEPGTDPSQLAREISDQIGENFIVKDRLQQQEVNFRMVSIEKWVTFILLVFILVIASFNIISTLCMIILDKGASLKTLSHIGMSRGRVGRIFFWESLLVTAIGGGCGLVLGLCVSLLQEKYGLIKLAGDPEALVIHAYPVKVEWLDLGVTMIPIAVIGIITAIISYSFARSRLNKVAI